MEEIQKFKRLSFEVSNEALLRSRVDQQSELICILKRRADEYLEKCIKYEKELSSIIEDRDKLGTQYKHEKEKLLVKSTTYAQLQTRHETLQQQYDKMCLDHEQQKTTLDLLHNENDKLKIEKQDSERLELKELHAQLEEKLEEIKTLKTQRKAKEKINQKHLNELQTGFESTKNKLQNELKSSRDEQTKTKEKFSESKDALTTSKHNEKTVTKQCKQLERDIDDLKSDLALMHRNSIEEKKKTKEREDQITNLMNTIESTTKKALQLRIVELEDEHAKQLLQFETYKKHVQEVLLKERQLNSHLRHVKNQTSK